MTFEEGMQREEGPFWLALPGDERLEKEFGALTRDVKAGKLPGVTKARPVTREGQPLLPPKTLHLPCAGAPGATPRGAGPAAPCASEILLAIDALDWLQYMPNCLCSLSSRDRILCSAYAFESSGLRVKFC